MNRIDSLKESIRWYELKLRKVPIMRKELKNIRIELKNTYKCDYCKQYFNIGQKGFQTGLIDKRTGNWCSKKCYNKYIKERVFKKSKQ